MKCVAIVQARTSSSRLPGKVLELLDGVPMIVFMLRRIARARKLNHFLVATSRDKSDDMLTRVVVDHGFDCYRGDLTDVLGRYHAAATLNAADVIVRLTGDCPLMDADLIDRSVCSLIEGQFDYVSNTDPPTFPDGLDVEAFTYKALQKSHESAHSLGDREHVTPYIRRMKASFSQATLRSSIDLSKLRWTVDHADDLEFVRALIRAVPRDEIAIADRFSFLRALEQRGTDMPSNLHGRNERFSDSSASAEQQST